MAQFEERIFISEFNILPTKSIQVRKTTEISKDGAVVNQTYWRCVLEPNDPQAATVLADEPYYLNIATVAWQSTTQPEPEE